MAEFFTQVSSRSQDQLVGGSKLVPVRVVAFTTIPNEIYAEIRLDLSIIDPTQIGGIIDVTARAIEDVAGRADVAALSYFQDVNPAGQLVDMLEVIVQSTSGNSTEAADYPLGDVVALSFGTSPSAKIPSIPQIVAQLDAIEAL